MRRVVTTVAQTSSESLEWHLEIGTSIPAQIWTLSLGFYLVSQHLSEISIPILSAMDHAASQEGLPEGHSIEAYGSLALPPGSYHTPGTMDIGRKPLGVRSFFHFSSYQHPIPAYEALWRVRRDETFCPCWTQLDSRSTSRTSHPSFFLLQQMSHGTTSDDVRSSSIRFQIVSLFTCVSTVVKISRFQMDGRWI